MHQREVAVVSDKFCKNMRQVLKQYQSARGSVVADEMVLEGTE